MNFIADIVLVIVFLQHFHGTEAVGIEHQFRHGAQAVRPWRWAERAGLRVDQRGAEQIAGLPDEITVPVAGFRPAPGVPGSAAKPLAVSSAKGPVQDGVRPFAVLEPGIVAVRDWSPCKAGWSPWWR